MEPTNNPIPTPNPDGGVSPAPAAPVDGVGVNPVGGATSVPVASTNPIEGVAGVTPTPVDLAASVPAPVNPVINPSGAAPVNPIVQPEGIGVAATDPIMMPEQPKAPDPIEEELKAPMKAAAPAPGSIGSAVSGPESSVAVGQGADSEPSPISAPVGTTPNVAFTDPATQPEQTQTNVQSDIGKKQTNKTTLIALIVIVILLVIGLAVFLAMQLMGGN